MFTVEAGKWDGDEENTKYIKSFTDLSVAISVLLSVNDYPWSRITFQDNQGRMWDITPRLMQDN